MTLHFKKLEGSYLLVRLQRPDRVVRKECLAGLLGAIEDDPDIIVASLPGIANKFFQSRFKDGSQFIAKPVECLPQRSAPLLVPGVTAGVASAIATPAFDAMDTTPRAVFNDLHEVLGRMLFQKLAVVGELGDPLLLDFLEGIGERHLAVAVMMTVALSVRGNVNQLRSLTRVGEAAHQPVGEPFAIVQ